MNCDEASGVLGVSRYASWEVVKGAYKAGLMNAHPDKGGKGEVTNIIKAFAVMKNEMNARKSERFLGTRDEGPWSLKVRVASEQQDNNSSVKERKLSKELTDLYSELHNLQREEQEAARRQPTATRYRQKGRTLPNRLYKQQ
eukprot:TRINITY_DN12969_c0_g1_i1.p1 TRINITY_DN12969_c0_g1~~TRINITY_DN12969_c0_g1_i1.p1  ORF type:complete len:142 (+),score=33.88 TRINITY_DN12969_c0_g1_i1:98-523(+)